MGSTTTPTEPVYWAAIVRYKDTDLPKPVIMFAQYLGALRGHEFFSAHSTLVVHGPYDAAGAEHMNEAVRASCAESMVWELVWAGTDMDEARARHAALTALER